MLLQRTLTALLLAPLAILVILLPPTWLFAPVVAVVFMAALWEWTRLSGLRNRPVRGALLGVALVVFALLWWQLALLQWPLLIAGVGPLPRLGVAGAALTSVMVRGGGFVIGIVIAWRRGLIRLDAPDWRVLPTIFRVGAPMSLAGVLLSFVYMWLTRFTSRFGTPALAALGVGHKIEGLGFIAIAGFGLSAAALVGQNLGARQEARARAAVRLTVLYCLFVTVTTAVAFLIFPDALVRLFTSAPGVLEDGSLYLQIIAFAQIGQTFEIVLEGALAGAGYTLWPMAVGTVLTLLRIPLAAWWSGPLGLFGIWLALSLTAIARGVVNTAFWLSGTWRHQQV